MDNQKILILGSQGMLGGQLMKLFAGQAIGWDRGDGKLDVLRFSGPSLENFKNDLKSLGISIVINCIAYNNVDGAESEKETAFKFNSDLPGNLAYVCKQLGIAFVHFSTNYVFGEGSGEYAENDAPTPKCVYAQSKFEGEQAVAKSGANFYLIRTSVLFGPKGASEMSKKSFAEIMLSLAAKQNRVEVVSDEINSLTYAPDLAATVKSLLDDKKPFGVYHITNSGFASWYDFAKEIFRQKNLSVEVQPILGSKFARPATRPAKAVLKNTKLPPLRPWQEALQEFLISNF